MIFRWLALFFSIFLGCTVCAGRPVEFSVVAYNVENLFDVDGVAIFDDYRQDEADDPFTYSRRKLLTKLENAASVLAALDPYGPDVILLQELEGDFTPGSAVTDFDAFLKAHSAQTIEEMLVREWKPEYVGIPAVAWLLKTLDDLGMSDYHVVVAPTKPFDSGIAHVNAIFTRFPVQQVHFHELSQARDIIEAELDIGGHSLWVYNNHWKSGASNLKREPIRVRNAKVLKSLVDDRLEKDPQADILIGGDLNSHYNHSILYPELKTGINDVLGSQFREGEGHYNLWYEVPPPQRYSEIWRGRRGTLMHLIVAPGLYDSNGISYLDGSFRVGQIIGVNADAMGRPLEWNFAGRKGGGASDHFPLIARFRIGPFEAEAPLHQSQDALDFEMRHDADPTIFPERLPDGSFFGGDLEQDPGDLVGRLFAVEAKVVGKRPLRLSVGGRVWAAYAPAPHVFEALEAGVETELIVSYGYWKGKPQLVVAAIRQP
ncbi:endonuclease/exonuclease/phosphatase family protein [Coraliomargarita sinensis]|nr:endonuclease/exonuclease/phosphatase family protein [Coraliomargarita sinensis]